MNAQPFCDKEEFMLSSMDIEQVFHPFLVEMQLEVRYEQESLPKGLNVWKSINFVFQVV